jgi:hypothetical protein
MYVDTNRLLVFLCIISSISAVFNTRLCKEISSCVFILVYLLQVYLMMLSVIQDHAASDNNMWIITANYADGSGRHLM